MTYLKLLCEQIPELDVVKAYNHPETFLADLPAIDFDLCILDIEMPALNGLQVAEALKGKLVIFATAYKEFAAEAFDLNAVDYLRKPVTKERLQQAVQKALLRKEKTPARNFIQLNTDKGKSLIFFDTIAYIESSAQDSRDKVAQLLDGQELTLKNISFEKLESLLPTAEFCRINKKQMVALKCILHFSHDQIVTTHVPPMGKAQVLILNETYRGEFVKKMKM